MSTTSPPPARAEADPDSGVSRTAANAAPCRVLVKSWETIALWSWDVASEACAICKCALSDVCVECQTRSSLMDLPTAKEDGPEARATAPQAETEALTTPSSCQVSWGMCGHVFHSHCLNRWLPQRPSCPLCNRAWELRQVTSND